MPIAIMYTAQMMCLQPKRSEYGDTFTHPNCVNDLSNEAEYIIITHDDFVEEANNLPCTPPYAHGIKIFGLDLI